MLKIPGKEIAQKIIDELKSRPKPEKFLAAVLVGENPVSINFLKQKEKTAKELGINFRLYQFPESIKNDGLRKEVLRIVLLKKVGGVIIQLPLPEHLNKHYILNVIPREKDVDVIGERALGAFYANRNPVLPPAVAVVKEIVDATSFRLQASKITVVGLGFLIGKPVSTWLMTKCSEIYLLRRGSNLEILKQADLVISGVGKAGLIKPEMLKSEASIIDFGYDIDGESKIRGDFDASELEIKNSKLEISWYTPTPGGTGPILVAKLFENFYTLCK
jgi:methylenetetrahydrofolate dehydrogenase (NADP+)/methenyltetrahydrofolate cyclohydrolase